ncbi:MAG TPA: hypothetical protein VGA95_11045 [Thermodesulfobacteriota bacterium]
MKLNNSNHVDFTVHITEDIYSRVLNIIKTQRPLEMSSIQEIIRAGLLKIKIDTIKKENSQLISQIENLRKETQRLIEENDNLEKLCSESKRDNEYICNRLEKLNSENQELEILVRRESSVEPGEI